MFKKILIPVIVFSPLLFFAGVGYPILSKEEFRQRAADRNLHYSLRCNPVSDFRMLIGCYKTKNRINALQLGNRLQNELGSMQELFPILFLAAFTGQIIFAALFLLKNE